MGRVTAIKIERGQRKRTRVFLNGRLAFRLETKTVLEAALRVGQELSDEQIEALTRADRSQRCLNAAAHYLSYRPRSEAELRERLHRRGFDDDSIESALELLKGQGLVDDVSFARFWRDNRESFSPRSRWLTRLELRQKGIAEDIVDQVVDAVDDDDSAYRAAANKRRSLSETDYQSFRRRLGAYLKRRGFSYGVIDHTVRRMWLEQREQY